MEVVIAVHLWAVEKPLIQRLQTWGYLQWHDIHRGAQQSLTPAHRRVIHNPVFLRRSAEYQGRTLAMHLNPPLIHFCNYKFSTVWKTLVDNFLHLRINRVES